MAYCKDCDHDMAYTEADHGPYLRCTKCGSYNVME